MSEDKKDNVIEGIFPRADEIEEAFTSEYVMAPAGEMLDTLADWVADDASAMAVSIIYAPGMPIMLAANVGEEFISTLLDMGKFEIMRRLLDDHYEEGPKDDDTVH